MKLLRGFRRSRCAVWVTCAVCRYGDGASSHDSKRASSAAAPACPRVIARADTDVVHGDDGRQLATEVRRRLDAGEALAAVGRWLYLGPAERSPMVAIKALVFGSGRRLAECTDVMDDVIAEVDPESFERTLALRVDFTTLMDEWADQHDPGPQS